jgi:hypothetical protein
MSEHEHIWRYTTSMRHPELGPFGACDECGAVDYTVFGPFTVEDRQEESDDRR